MVGTLATSRLFQSLLLPALLLSFSSFRGTSAADITLTCAADNDQIQCGVLQEFCNGDPTASDFCSSAPNWAVAASGTATDYCTFAGVTCDLDSNIVGLCVYILSLLLLPRISDFVLHRNVSAAGLAGHFPAMLSGLRLTYLCALHFADLPHRFIYCCEG